jgi:hypothetical protein
MSIDGHVTSNDERAMTMVVKVVRYVSRVEMVQVGTRNESMGCESASDVLDENN